MKLEEFKKIYEELEKKHNLPKFDEMNSAFDIGKIKRNSGTILRDLRNIMIEKVSYYIRLVEVMISPSQASPTLMMLLKEITKDDKKSLDSVFTAFIGLEIENYKMNISSKHSDEVDFILKIYKTWNENIQELNSIVSILERNWKQINNSPKQSRNYFN